MGSKVIFTVVADHGEDHGPFDEDKTLVFNTAITNVGGAYDQTSGLFTAYVSGYYYFALFYHAGQKHKSGLTLMKNSEVIFNTFDVNKEVERLVDNAGNAVFLHLKRGNKVFVRLPANYYVYASDQATTFSGFLVYDEMSSHPLYND